jgi:hypothetical protein
MGRLSGRKIMDRLTLKAFLFAVYPIAFALMANSADAAQYAGAIFTSNSDGTTVNQNIYLGKDLVYLNGGPRNYNAAGLPNGTYYFLVTDPSGNTLLSTDPVACRQLTVANGVVSGATGSCPHANGAFNSSNGSTPVQLSPYNDTPNNGGVYKAWLVSQAGNIGCGPDKVQIASDGIGLAFPSNCAKTDNFKVNLPPGTVSISGYKYYDSNTNGVPNYGEADVQGIQINITTTEPNASPKTDIQFTDADGAWSKNGLSSGTTFTVCEALPPPPPTWIQTGPIVESNASTAAADGARCWGGTATTDVDQLNFGNVCLGAGNGLTLGFWSNKNGKARMTGSWQETLNQLNLKTATGGDQDFGAYDVFRSWILGATATNMAYMLSAQMAAMQLNISIGGSAGKNVPAGAMLYAGPVPQACVNAVITVPVNQAGFIGAQDLVNTASAAAGAYSVSVNASDARTCQEYLKNTLDKGNNNLNFVAAPASCTVSYPINPQ